jgi:peptide/nickel transport system substrate-binding protein
MSSVSWAYPWENKDDGQSKQNGHDYTQWSATTDAEAEAKVQKYMDAAGVKAGDSSLSITFTIAGSSITEHPTYAVFLNAQRILNNLGWNVEIKADSQALTKLSTGSLEVWAAAWGSTIDPDMYQVYHKNSTATSVYAWGYREIKSNKSLYSYENGIIDKLSDIIEDARSTNNQALRKDYYETAMGYVLDLAIELPVYQRKNLYAYNSNTVKGFPTTVNEYSSPLEKIWELELV